MSDINVSENSAADRGPVGVGGWLAFFVLSMMVFSPLMDAVYFGGHPAELNLVSLLLVVAVHGLGLYAGILMLRRKAKGVRWAKIRLYVSAGVGVLGAIGSIVGGLADPHATTTAPEFMASLRAIGYSAIWLAYLTGSKRVKNTYGAEEKRAEPVEAASSSIEPSSPKRNRRTLIVAGTIAALILAVGLSGYRAYQKSHLEQEDAEIWSNVKASTEASNQWNADTDATPIKLAAIRELAIKDAPIVEEAQRRLTQAQEGWYRRIQHAPVTPTCQESMNNFFTLNAEIAAVQVEVKNLEINADFDTDAGLKKFGDDLNALIARENAAKQKLRTLPTSYTPCEGQ